jgi:hypothetical protein
VTTELIRITTALAVIAVVGVAAIISSQHAYELVTYHGESGATAHLLPFAQKRRCAPGSSPTAKGELYLPSTPVAITRSYA